MTFWSTTWALPPLRGLGAIVKSALTAPDGQSWAPGRILGFATFLISQCAAMRITQGMLPRLVTPEQCQSFFIGLAAFEGATGATCIALVLGMAPTDVGGKWWSKDASPPRAP